MYNNASFVVTRELLYTIHWHLTLSARKYISIFSISENKCHVLRSPYKKDEQSATDCEVLKHHPLNTPYWDWAERLNLRHLTPLQYSGLANVETALFGVVC
jgi:hypothetical protein